jgi:putative oxygen-independent coproporphyrinogen III oxidase
VTPSNPGLYLHIPFCSAICPYCDFAVLTGGEERKAEFVESLAAEARLWRESRDVFPQIDTIYFGGGTPSALTPEQITGVLSTLEENLSIGGGARIFFEANPEDVTPASARAWRDLGVRTVSLGIQSLDADALRFLGRRHTPEQARRSTEIAREAGFETVSLDLIYGLPGQTPEAWRRTLDQAAALAPDHLSCYQLTIHEKTPFGFRLARGKLTELPEPEQAELFRLTHRILADHGFPAYEVSSFARAPEHRSLHNRKYWDRTPYLGLGPSAHSFDGERRWWNERKLKPWQARIAAGGRPVAGSEELSPSERALETLMLGLRTAEGIDLGLVRERFGLDLRKRNARRLEALQEERLVRIDGDRVIPTLEGWAVADALARDFELAGR